MRTAARVLCAVLVAFVGPAALTTPAQAFGQDPVSYPQLVGRTSWAVGLDPRPGQLYCTFDGSSLVRASQSYHRHWTSATRACREFGRWLSVRAGRTYTPVFRTSADSTRLVATRADLVFIPESFAGRVLTTAPNPRWFPYLTTAK